jgi:hypothetical protein
MKKRMLALFMCGMLGISSLIGCGKEEPAPVTSEEVTTSTVSEEAVSENAETVSDDTVSDDIVSENMAKLTEDDVKAMMAAVDVQMKKNPDMAMDVYTVSGNDVSKAFVIGFAKTEDGIGYAKIASPAVQMEIYREEDGHLYVDMAAEVSEDEVAQSEDEGTVYFDGNKYHYLQKSEPQEGVADEENGDITTELADTMDNPAFDKDSEIIVYNQKEADGYTIVATAVKVPGKTDTYGYTDADTEQHMLLYVKDGTIDKIVASSSEQDATKEAYSIMTIGGSGTITIPEYFNDVEYTDAEKLEQTAAFSMFAVMMTMMDTEQEIVPTGEWAANAGAVSMEDVELFREMLEAGTYYFPDSTVSDGSAVSNDSTEFSQAISDTDNREFAEETKIGDATYMVWKEASLGGDRTGTVQFQIFTTDGAPAALDTDSLTVEYTGGLKVRINDITWVPGIADDRIDAVAEFEISAKEADDAVVSASDFVIK